MNHSEEVSAGENDQIASAQRLSEYTAKGSKVRGE